jgi:hypothetical protein
MSENQIKVSAATNEPIRVNVIATSSQGGVTLSQDTSVYNAGLAEQWAISENLVLGKDYSSKFYAKEAKESAKIAEGFENLSRELYNNFSGNVEDTISSIQTKAEEVFNESIAEYTEIANQIKQDNSESSKLAKDWAISEVIVDNLDYSAKYWAGKAKDNSGIFYDEISDEDIDVEIISGGYVTKSDLELGLDTKQDKGDYALRNEIPDITPLATKQELTQGLNTKQPKGNYALVEDIPTQVSELENDSNYATQTQVLQAIASIPQFKLSIVEALPTTGEKMTLYLVPKEGTNNDVYDEYIWIEQTSSFEHLGTTAVDLTDYVKNTDYATETTYGVVKTNFSRAIVMSAGSLGAGTKTLEQYNAYAQGNMFIGKGTLENIKNNYVKEAITTNDITLTDAEKLSARTWLGAVGFTDYASGSKGGVIRVDNGNYGTAITSGYLTSPTKTLEQYGNARVDALIGKGTLNNVLTQYSKTVLTTEADYEALETKDANTLYLIEE